MSIPPTRLTEEIDGEWGDEDEDNDKQVPANATEAVVASKPPATPSGPAAGPGLSGGDAATSSALFTGPAVSPPQSAAAQTTPLSASRPDSAEPPRPTEDPEPTARATTPAAAGTPAPRTPSSPPDPGATATTNQSAEAPEKTNSEPMPVASVGSSSRQLPTVPEHATTDAARDGAPVQPVRSPSSPSPATSIAAPAARGWVTRRYLWIVAAAVLVTIAVLGWAARSCGSRTEPIELKAEPGSTQAAPAEPTPSAPQAQAPQLTTEPQPSSLKERAAPDSRQDRDEVERKSAGRRRGRAVPRRGHRASRSDTSRRTDTTAASERESEPAAPESTATTVTLSTIPAGTKVYRGGQSEGTTPLSYGVSTGERIVLRLVKEGYVTQSVVLDGSRAQVRLVMVKADGTSTSAQGALR